MTRLLEGPVKPWIGEHAEEVASLDKPDYKGFMILQDSRIIDLRGWKPAADRRQRTRLRGLWLSATSRSSSSSRTRQPSLRIELLTTSPEAQVRFPPQQLKPKLLGCSLANTPRGEKQVSWEATVDFQKVPDGESLDIIYEHLSPGEFLRHVGVRQR